MAMYVISDASYDVESMAFACCWSGPFVDA